MLQIYLPSSLFRHRCHAQGPFMAAMPFRQRLFRRLTFFPSRRRAMPFSLRYAAFARRAVDIAASAATPRHFSVCHICSVLRCAICRRLRGACGFAAHARAQCESRSCYECAAARMLSAARRHFAARSACACAVMRMRRCECAWRMPDGCQICFARASAAARECACAEAVAAQRKKKRAAARLTRAIRRDLREATHLSYADLRGVHEKRVRGYAAMAQ